MGRQRESRFGLKVHGILFSVQGAFAHPFSVCAAPHLPAGILSPYSDGERGALISRFRQSPSRVPALRPVSSG
ncbi:MAG: hypothetical protein E5X80_29620 [Mesorhizobium sp.]|nr:MAG: hypothetical protein EOR71_29980 [Mesorhizobium sp.]TIO47975.1 MAG: hypothetical protein E5X78_30820 [Mesorhizobium sp.]TIO56390.1 MAG: hypothetical protein E5X79_30710 [Mesorhizobium sp.]TJV57649.1 MAG: hypothetical protein E5X80_29620 [Mesorhizobium sp.]